MTFPAHFGAEITVSFDELMRGGTRWRNMLYDRKMLVFRDLHLTPQQFIDVHKLFGRPWSPELYALSREIPVRTNDRDCYTLYDNVLMKDTLGTGEIGLHRDIPWHREIRYPIRSLYPTTVLTDAGGETVFVDADRIWDRISVAQAAKIKRAVIDIQSWYDVVFKSDTVGRRKIPLVEMHLHTKRISFLLNSVHQKGWIQGWELDGVEQDLQELHNLHALVDTPDNTYTHSWRLGDLVLFDNWSGIMHGRRNLLRPGLRAFWRINVKHYWQR